MKDDFKEFEDMAIEIYDHVAVCRTTTDKEFFFNMPFKNKEILQDFLIRNTGDPEEIGFYTKGYSNGEFVGDNGGEGNEQERAN